MDLETPDISWEGETPRSSRFKDIYYSPDNGLAESEYVFVENNFLKSRWANQFSDNFVIAETGFGTGLNFLATCKLWNELQLAHQKLHFISFEKYPLSKIELEKALNPFKELTTYAKKLIGLYPVLQPGFHRINFDENISLTLYLGDALTGLNKLEESLSVDAWYFDGFNPSENGTIWSEEIFTACSRFSHENTSFSTFTAAGHVRRKLDSAGFTTEKVKGFGKKREMLRGHFKEKQKIESVLKYEKKPWIRPFPVTNQQNKTVAVIGGGLAGCWTAFHLAKRNLSVTLLESEDLLASGASGNPRGATYFKLMKDWSSENRFYLDAFLYSVRLLNQLGVPEDIWTQSGLTQFNKDFSLLNSTHSEIVQKNPHDKYHRASLNFPLGGHINPRALCEWLITQAKITCIFKNPVQSLKFDETTQHWQIKSSGGNFNFTHVVIANSFSAINFEQCSNLPLNTVRGQSTQIASTQTSELLKEVLCDKGYLTPAINGEHTIGSTFDPRNNALTILEKDNETNLAYLKESNPDFYESLQPLKVTSARAAFRCQSPDMLPLLGPLASEDTFNETFSKIRKGQIKKTYQRVKNLPNFYINLAHASRGLISTPYCAEILANLICSEPLACEQAVFDLLAPNRFLFRQLKKS